MKKCGYLVDAYAKAKEILKANENIIHQMANVLLEKNIFRTEEFKQMMDSIDDGIRSNDTLHVFSFQHLGTFYKVWFLLTLAFKDKNFTLKVDFILF